jgi:hypothetical protein
MSAAAIRFLPDRVEIGDSTRLFASDFVNYTANVSEDGQRFLLFMRPGEEEDDSNPLTVVLNWQARLK